MPPAQEKPILLAILSRNRWWIVVLLLPFGFVYIAWITDVFHLSPNTTTINTQNATTTNQEWNEFRLDNLKYSAEFFENLPPFSEWSSFTAGNMLVPLPKGWKFEDANYPNSPYLINFNIEPTEQASLYERSPQIFLPSIQISTHEIYKCASSGTLFCHATDDTILPSTPEKLIEDLKEIELYDPHCKCTRELDPYHLKGLGVDAYVLLQGGTDDIVYEITYIFKVGPDVYSVKFNQAHNLSHIFIEDFLNNIRSKETSD